MTKRLQPVGARLTDEERARFDALKMVYGLDPSRLIRLALDRLYQSLPVTPVSPPDQR